MHGRRPPPFFFTKKNPADAGEVDGRMKPLANSSSMYALMASDSGWERGNTLPFVGIAPGSRSIAQSLDRCSGSCDALDLLKASERSWYSTGRFLVEGVSESGEGVDFASGQWNCRHSWWQNSDHCWICFADQEIRGLCFSSQGRPRITGFWGESMAKRHMRSMCREPVLSVSTWVLNWTSPGPRVRPSSAVTASRVSHVTRGRLWKLAKLISIKFPAAPESIKAVVSTATPEELREMGTIKVLEQGLTEKVDLVGGWVGQLTRRCPDCPQ